MDWLARLVAAVSTLVDDHTSIAANTVAATTRIPLKSCKVGI
jgi:hypothetical protein